MNHTSQTLHAVATTGASGAGASPSPARAGQHRPWRVAIISASWHRDIVQQAVTSARAELQRQDMGEAAIRLVEVPGAFEIPLHAQRLARSGGVDAVIACGLVVDGGIYRHDFVASAVIDGLMRVQLDTGVPVFSVVLTPHHFHEHAEHLNYFHTHFVKKGQEAATACVATLGSLEGLTAAAA
jgi:6,7-dimethyl-8-ribityllumazine synthase